MIDIDRRIEDFIKEELNKTPGVTLEEIINRVMQKNSNDITQLIVTYLRNYFEDLMNNPEKISDLKVEIENDLEDRVLVPLRYELNSFYEDLENINKYFYGCGYKRLDNLHSEEISNSGGLVINIEKIINDINYLKAGLSDIEERLNNYIYSK